MRVTVDGVRELRFDDGSPVTAASAVAPLGNGWLVAQDDATSAAWVRPDGVHPVGLLPPVEGHDRFTEAAGTKQLKPDLEVACPAEVDGEPAVLLLGSGSTPRRMRGVLVQLVDGEPVVAAAELGPLYARVADVLGTPLEQLNLEGASRSGGTVRWFQRGNLAAGVPSAGVDVPLAALVDAVRGGTDPAAVAVTAPGTHDLGEVAGVGLAVTDAVALPDGRLLLSAAAEDTPNAVDDGPVVAAALVLVDGTTVQAVAPLPEVAGRVLKVEGLALRSSDDREARLLAVVDADDPAAPSVLLELTVQLD
ncbi:hypothetical protein GCU67_08920 [Modestobacter muralis]|uniref:Uncharacterized protein n=1 Tax=Modestobacter muralis TaxID=1608614 RepID=A0A6P0ERP3_9ACTN|nr:hypothetical protein [Modestobacter muralis]NEK94292.1 hypothetical protein [Modestobacter muralis]NEN51180.1 hypothetical protein [Modestobacter muralis]